MGTLLCESSCMNNGLFVRLPVSAVHVFHNWAWTITGRLCVHAVRVSLFTGICFPALMFQSGPRCSRSAWCYWLDTFFCIIIRPPFTSQAHVRSSFRDSTGIQNMLKTLLQPHLKYIITNHLSNHSATNHLIWFSIYRLPKSYPTGNISAYLLLNLSERWCQNVLLCLEAVFMPVLGLHRR